MRKRQAKKRPLLPDPKFNDQLVTRFVNNLMWDGKKSTAFEKRHTLIYHPTQIFTRNSLNVPMLSRTYDDMYAGWHVSNLVTMNGFGFAYTNVTVSYKFIKRIGFWDTNYETIAEDIHLAFKAHFKTQGETRCISIFIPFNNVNV